MKCVYNIQYRSKKKIKQTFIVLVIWCKQFHFNKLVLILSIKYKLYMMLFYTNIIVRLFVHYRHSYSRYFFTDELNRDTYYCVLYQNLNGVTGRHHEYGRYGFASGFMACTQHSLDNQFIIHINMCLVCHNFSASARFTEIYNNKYLERHFTKISRVYINQYAKNRKESNNR